MSVPRATAQRAGAGSIVHPYFLRDRLAPLLDADRPGGLPHDHETFEQMRARSHAAVATVGVVHEGTKGRAVHRVKATIQRSLYWYVDPAFAALRETNLALVDVVESLATDVDELRQEVASLRRDLESGHEARRRAISDSTQRDR